MPPFDVARRPAPPSHHRARIFLALAALLTALTAAGCSTASPARGKATPSPSTAPSHASPAAGRTAPAPTGGPCKTPPAADIPGAAGALTQTASGTFCLTVGRQLQVFLTAPGPPRADAARWSSVTSSDLSVLAPRSSGILTAPLGVTPGVFQALSPGTVELSSRLAPDREWHVLIQVTAA